MAFETWTPSAVPQLGSGFTDDQLTDETNFGDNYNQFVGIGINSIFAAGDLNWNGLTETQLAEVRVFWRSKGKATPFLWTVPGEGSPRLWRFSAAFKFTPLGRATDGTRLYSASTSIKEAFDKA